MLRGMVKRCVIEQASCQQFHMQPPKSVRTLARPWKNYPFHCSIGRYEAQAMQSVSISFQMMMDLELAQTVSLPSCSAINTAAMLSDNVGLALGEDISDNKSRRLAWLAGYNHIFLSKLSQVGWLTLLNLLEKHYECPNHAIMQNFLCYLESY